MAFEELKTSEVLVFADGFGTASFGWHSLISRVAGRLPGLRLNVAALCKTGGTPVSASKTPMLAIDEKAEGPPMAAGKTPRFAVDETTHHLAHNLQAAWPPAIDRGLTGLSAMGSGEAPHHLG